MGKKKRLSKKERKLMRDKAKSPGDCFCHREIDSAEAMKIHNRTDAVLGYTEPMHSFYDYSKTGPTTKFAVRRCSRCGKGWVDAPVIA